jgi:flagellin
MSSDSITVHGQDATSGTPKVDSTVMISDNHGNSQAVAVNDTDTSFSGTGFFSGLNVNLTSGKSLADLTGNASSTVTLDSEITTAPSDAQLKITIDGATPYVFTAAQLRNYNSGAGVKTGTDLCYFLRGKGVPFNNAWIDVGSGPGWGILSSNSSSVASVSVEVTGSSAAQRSAIETLLGMQGDSITLYGEDATSNTPKVDSIVTISDNHGNSQDIVVDDGDTSLTGTGYFAGLSVHLKSGKVLSDLNGGAASALSFDSVMATTPASDAHLKVTVNGAATTISAEDMRNYNSGAGVQTGDDLYQLLKSKGVNVSTSGSSDPNWKIQSPNQAASATVSVDITGSSAPEKTAIRTLLGISGNSVTVHGQDASAGSPSVSSIVTISDNHGHSEAVSVNDGDSSFTGTGYFSALSVSLASGKTLKNLTGNAASTLVIPGGADPAPTNTASAAQFANHVLTADATCTAGIDVTTQAAASSAIQTINNAIGTVSSQRSQLGSCQNALEHTINNLSKEDQDLTSALSQITDLDMAEEMTLFVRNKILVEASRAMLAQANQQPQGVLSLLM